MVGCGRCRDIEVVIERASCGEMRMLVQGVCSQVVRLKKAREVGRAKERVVRGLEMGSGGKAVVERDGISRSWVVNDMVVFPMMGDDAEKWTWL